MHFALGQTTLPNITLSFSVTATPSRFICTNIAVTASMQDVYDFDYDVQDLVSGARSGAILQAKHGTAAGNGAVFKWRIDYAAAPLGISVAMPIFVGLPLASVPVEERDLTLEFFADSIEILS